MFLINCIGFLFFLFSAVSVFFQVFEALTVDPDNNAEWIVGILIATAMTILFGLVWLKNTMT